MSIFVRNLVFSVTFSLLMFVIKLIRTLIKVHEMNLFEGSIFLFW